METSAKRNVNRRASVPLHLEICTYEIPGRRLGIQILIASADEQYADQVLARRQGIQIRKEICAHEVPDRWLGVQIRKESA